jgi:hypothetical protein
VYAVKIEPFLKAQFWPLILWEVLFSFFGMCASKRVLLLRTALIPVLIAVSAFTAFATGEEEFLDQYGHENGLVLLQKQNVQIIVDDDGKLRIESDVYEETIHLKETAKFFSEQSISYSSTFSDIQNIEAYSLVPNDRGRYKKYEVSSINTTDSRSDGIFYDDQKQKSFYYPALDVGAKTVLSYKKIYNEPRLWGYFVFSSFFPVQASEFSVTMPKTVKLNFKLHGIDEDRVTFSEIEKGGEYTYTWKAANMDKIRMGKGSSGVLHHAPHIIVYIDSYEYNGERHSVLSGVDDLYSWYQSFVKEAQVNDSLSAEFTTTVAQVVADHQTEMEKVKAIYAWVQKNIKYIAIEDGLGGFIPRDAGLVFKRRYGDCKDMSNLLYRMLEVAGIPSHLTWIGTTAIPYSHREVPTPMADNHMICTYKQHDQYYFLDATDPYNKIGVPSSHIQGQEALIDMGNEEYELVQVPVVPFDENRIVDSVNVYINDGRIQGKGLATYSGYMRIPVADHLLNLDEKDTKNFLTSLLNKGNNKFFIEDLAIANNHKNDDDLTISYDFLLEDYLIKTDHELIFNPHMSKDFEDNLIDLQSEVEDVHYQYKNLTANVFRIQIPDGYKVEYSPEDIHVNSDAFGFDLSYDVNQSEVVVKQQVYINTLQLKPSQFSDWNTMLRKLYGAYKESIVFKKL